MNGDTLLSLKNASGFVLRFVSGVAVIFGGFAGILGFSARFTGGGIGDFGLCGKTNGFGFAAMSAGVPGWEVSPGVGALVEDLLLCCETKSRTFPITLSGDLDFGLAN